MGELDKAIEQEKQAVLSAIVESSDDAIISKTLEGIIVSWNQGAQKIFEYTEEEIIGKHITILIPKALQAEEEVIIHNIRSGNKIDHFQTIRLSKTGREIPISLTVSPVKDKNGTIIGASKIARDISYQLEREAEIKRLFEEVKMLNAKKDEFIALASHELKTPLTTVKGYLQLLQKKEQDKVGELFLTKSLRQIEKLDSLISDLFDISKIESGKLQLHYERIDMHELIVNLIETFQYTFSTHKIILEDKRQEAYVEADAQRIEQVITNLFSNAIKYSPHADQVLVSLSSSETEMTIKVKDWGIGLDQEQQHKIFTRFYRVDGNSTIGGLGLGLYLTKEIIDRHGGRIFVSSELGKGSEFYIVLPRNRP